MSADDREDRARIDILDAVGVLAVRGGDVDRHPAVNVCRLAFAGADGELAIALVNRVPVLRTFRSNVRAPVAEECLSLAGDLGLHDLDVRCEERHRGECCRTDRKALTRRCGGVTERVEHVGALTHHRRLTGHFRVAARVIRDRTVRVGREGDPESREHPDRRDTDAVETHEERVTATGERERKNNRDNNGQQRRPGGLHAFRDTRDDDGRRTRECLFRDALGWGMLVRGVVLRRVCDHET